MKKLLLIIGIGVTVFIFTGCKTYIDTKLKVSDLLESKTKLLDGDLFIEVPACGSYKDSRIPSKGVIEAKHLIPDVFKDSKYIECFKKNMSSYAHFKIPIMLDKDKDGKLASDDYIVITSNDTTLLNLNIPQPLQKRIEDIKHKNNYIDSLNLSVSFQIENDTGKEFPLRVYGAYVDTLPFLYGELSIKKDGNPNIVLSNVSTSAALRNGYVLVLDHSKSKD